MLKRQFLMEYSVENFKVRWSELEEIEEQELTEQLNRHFRIEFGFENPPDTEILEKIDVPLFQNMDDQQHNQNEIISVEGNGNDINLTSDPPQMNPNDFNANSPNDEAETERFVLLDESEVDEFVQGKQNKNTLKKTISDITLLRKFLRLKNECREIENIPEAELDVYLANFVLSVRKSDGEEFQPTSLRSKISSVDRYLKRRNYKYRIMHSGSENAFVATREAYIAKCRDLKQKGFGNKPNKSHPINEEEINLLYEKGLLGANDPNAIINTLWLNNTIHFGLRASTEHYTLMWGDISLKKTANGTEYLELNERQTKTRNGEKLGDVREVNPKMFANKELGERDPLFIYKEYARLRPANFCAPEHPYYIATRTIPLNDPQTDKWFMKMRMGENKIATIIKNETSCKFRHWKKLTNTSARKFLVQTLRSENIPPTDIAMITGHKSLSSINNYSELAEKQHENVSRILSNAARPKSHTLSHDPAHDMGVTSNKFVATTHSAGINTRNSSRQTSVAQSMIVNSSQPQNFQNLFYGATLNVKEMNVYVGPKPPTPSRHSSPEAKRHMVVKRRRLIIASDSEGSQ